LPARLNAVRTGQHLLKPDKYKDIIIQSLQFLVKEKRIELNAFAIMSNHIHLIWQIQSGHEREAVQRDFLKFVSQTIKRDLEKNHPLVLEKFYVGSKDSPDNNRDGNAIH
jgi:REP element-mobilizing transposase RayT